MHSLYVLRPSFRRGLRCCAKGFMGEVDFEQNCGGNEKGDTAHISRR